LNPTPRQLRRASGHAAAKILELVAAPGRPYPAPTTAVGGERLRRALAAIAAGERGELLLWPGERNLDEASQAELSRRLHRIIELQRAVAAAELDVQGVMKLICERTQELTGAHAAAVLLLEGDRLRYGAATGYLAEHVGGTISLRSLSGWAFLNNMSASTNDADRDARVHQRAAKRFAMRSMIVVPLRHGDKPIGLLQVSSRDADAFGDDDVHTLDLVSVVLSAAMSHAAEFEAKRAEVEALAQFEAIYRDSPIGVGLLSLDGRFVDTNQAMLDILGFTLEDATSQYVSDFTHPDDVHEAVSNFRDVVRGIRESARFDHRVFHKDGHVVWTQNALSAVRDADGTITFVIAMSQDVTQRKQAELALQANTERLARIVETQRDIAAAGLELDGVMRLMAERSQAITGAEGAMVNLIEGDELVTRAASGISARVVGLRRPLAETLTTHAIAAGRALLVEGADDPRVYRPLAEALGAGSHVCVPLFQGERAVGSLTVTSRSDEHRLTEGDRQTMELLAVVLSSAVSRAAEFEAKRQQVEALARFETTYQGAPIGITMIDLRGRPIESNPALQEILGYSGDELARLQVGDVMHPANRAAAEGLFREVAAGDRDSYRVEERLVRNDGETVWANMSVSLVRDPDGRPSFVVGMLEDITKRKLAEEAFLRQAELNEHQARHDALTGLANRVFFRDRIEQAIRAAERDGHSVAVLMMDLDRFKEVNDSLGHHAGDTLLKELGARLQGVLRASDSVARLGGDEFGLLLPEPTGADDIVRVIERIRDALERPIVVQGLPLAVEASIGVSLYPKHGRDVDTLLQRADVAMYIAKEENSAYAFYDEAVDHYDPTRLTLVGELRRAIEERELVLYYQPKMALATGEVRAVEALLRWHHPQRGLVMPDDFVPVAQQTGLIKPLTLYVLARALEQCRAWQEDGTPLSIAINLSTRNLLDVEFPDEVELLLDRWDVDPALVEFEITESTMLADPARTRGILERLAGMGIRLSIDDFGTGYSSLAYLKRLPVNEIKIDGSFVVGMATNEDDATIVRSTIDLGRNLGLDVVAEGVEDAETLGRLKRLGCTSAQGFFISPALAGEELHDWLRSRR
jgi:diguanylate cyclase (GGDEF)-like protein/PAS domain S-box-containing protein